MNEGKFIKMPTGKRGRMFLRPENAEKNENANDFIDRWNKSIQEGTLESFREIKENEIEKNDEQQEVLDLAVTEIKSILRKYGIDDAAVSPDLIYLVSSKFLNSKVGHSDLDDIHGVAPWNLQCCVIGVNDQLTKTQLVARAFHEMLHLFSFQRLKMDNFSAAGIIPEREGLSITSSKNPMLHYFDLINEAVVCQMTLDFKNKLLGHPLFKDEMEILGQFGEAAKNADALAKKINEDGEIVYGFEESYKTERIFLENLTQELYEKNKEKFASRDEVLEIFIEGLVTGKIMKLARLIKSTFGIGSFRELGERFSRKRY